MGQHTGYGRLAEELCLALLAAGVELSAVPLDASVFAELAENPRTHAIAANVGRQWDGDRYDAMIVCTLPEDCAAAFHRYSSRLAPSRPLRIAYTTWEAMQCPEHITENLMANFDEVWTCSEASRSALAGALGYGQSFATIPIPYDVDRMRSYLDKPRKPRPANAPLRFYWIGAWSARKNPDGLIRAFTHEFRRGDDHVELLLHSPGTPVAQLQIALASTGLTPNDHPPITLSSEYLDEDTLHGMHARGDVFVTAARGEAWNLPAFEAMLHGKCILSPLGLGSDDFLDDQESDAVRLYYSRVTPAWNGVIPAGDNAYKVIGPQGLTTRQLWRDPNLAELAEHMRDLYDNFTEAGAASPAPAFYDPSLRYGYAPVAALMLNRLENLR